MGAELKRFRFTFGGTLSDFNQAVVDLQSDNDDYLFDEKDGRYSFGVARGGHSGGYWYAPEYTETEGKLAIEGEIRYIDRRSDSKLDKAELVLLYVLLFPWVLISCMIRGIIFLVRKLLRSKPKQVNIEEDRLIRLMVDKLNCSSY